MSDALALYVYYINGKKAISHQEDFRVDLYFGQDLATPRVVLIHGRLLLSIAENTHSGVNFMFVLSLDSLLIGGLVRLFSIVSFGSEHEAWLPFFGRGRCDISLAWA
jgi:hypothetical protein